MVWTLTDASGNPINNATPFTATLYAGRSALDPDNVPGTPVSVALTGIVLSYIVASAGQYSALIPALSLDIPLGDDYTFVLDASVSAIPIYHAEPSVIVIENQN